MGNSNTKESRPVAATASSGNSRRSTRDRDRTTEREKRRAKRRESYAIRVDASETVDGGFLFPQGVYTGSQDFAGVLVRELIITRSLAPFYRPVDSIDPSWTDDELIAAVLKLPRPTESDSGAGPNTADSRSTSPEESRGASASAEGPESGDSGRSSESGPGSGPEGSSDSGPGDNTGRHRSDSAANDSISTSLSEPVVVNDPEELAKALANLAVSLDADSRTQTVWLYRNVHECPICFLMYPRLNSTQCCNQDICTECFVQIKRAPPHRPHGEVSEPDDGQPPAELISEPASCPYCNKQPFAVTFEAPPFEWGIARPTHPPANAPENAKGAPPVTTDMIRPDWKRELDSARRRLARKSAAAQALHASALLPAEPSSSHRRSSSSTVDPAPRRRRRSTLSDLVTTSRMSAVQVRELENRMLESAIQQSLREQ